MKLKRRYLMKNKRLKLETPFDFYSKITLKRRVFALLIWIILILSVNYLISVFTNRNERHFYSHSYDCATITKINQTTIHNGYPSLIIQEDIGQYELVLYGGYGAGYSDFEVGDKICKSSSTLNFIRISKSNQKDTFIVKDNKFLSFIFNGGIVIKPFLDTNFKCKCLNVKEE